MKKLIISLQGLHKNGEHVLIDFTFNQLRVRLTTNLNYPKELEIAYEVRNNLIFDLNENKFEIRNYSHYIKNLQSLEKHDKKFYKNKMSPTMNTLFIDSLSIMKEEVTKEEITDEYRDVHVYAIKNHLRPFFGNIKVTEVTVSLIQNFLSSLNHNLTKETVKGILKPLSRALNLAVSKEIIPMSPMKAMPYNKLNRFKTNNEKNTTTFSLSEATAIINAAEPVEFKNTIAFLLWTACRPCEAFSMLAEDINLDKSEIYIYKSKTRKQRIKGTKNGVARVIQIFPPLIPYLKSQLEICKNQTDKTLFKAPRGKPWRHSSHFGRFWKKTVEKLEGTIEYKNVYKLRSACITFLHRKKVPTGKISKFAGHLKITTTDRYIQFIKEDKDEIIIDDFSDPRHNYDMQTKK